MKSLRFTARTFANCITAAALSGCVGMLPNSRTEVVSTWSSYDEAANCLAKIQPYTATRADVHKEGLDPRNNPTIAVLHFADVLQKFQAAALLAPQAVDQGIRDCVQAGKRCTGYAVSIKKRSAHRAGNFWLDSLGFKRETHTTGWSVEALLVFVDDLVVYQLIGGQPTVNEYEVRRNPLGPLQGWGDRAL